MTTDFSRTLALLRKEKKLSQRVAAADLGVSQALLSHYENGLREPGLAFVARAADYYGVSCDYLLGRSMSRDGAAVSAQQLPDLSRQKDNVLRGSALAMLHKKLLVNSVALLMDLTGKTGSRQLITQVAGYLSLAVYRVYRTLYQANPDNNPAVFGADSEHFQTLCDIESARTILKIDSAARGGGQYGVAEEEAVRLALSPEELSRSYPETAVSLLSLLQTAGEQLQPRRKRADGEKKKGK